MLNKRQHKITKPSRSMLSLFLFIAGVFSLLLYSSNTTADPVAVDCLNSKIESHSHLGLIELKHIKELHYYHHAICKRVEDGRWSSDKANKVMGYIILRLGICRDASINPDYEKILKTHARWPDSVVLPYKKFCRDTYDPANKRVGVNFKRLQKQFERLTVEIFCIVMHEDAYPSSFWAQLFEPDLPCIKDYKDRTDSICEKLRNGDIEFSDAIDRWELASLEFDKRLGPEAVKKMGRDLEKPIGTLIDMFKTKGLD